MHACRSTLEDPTPARIPYIRLQQRLLSSPEAFAKSIDVHARAVEKRGGPVPVVPQLALPDAEDLETYGATDEAIQAEEDARLADESSRLPTLAEEARALLATLRAKAEKARRLPDAKVRALFAWLREHVCPSLGEPNSKTSRSWTERRVLIFTEWADTKRYLVELLQEAAAHTDDAENRITTFQGGMGDDAREDVQRRFTADPKEEPLRILVATDAAREGLNLQTHCADLFHIDLPWNPARLEQRNGRIDRIGQDSDEVRCHYFVYPARPEDRVLEALVRKIEIIQRELGSLGAVLMDDIEQELRDGIRPDTADRIEKIGRDAARKTVDTELEDTRETQQLRAEIDRALRRYEASAKSLEVTPESLRGVFEVGLRLAGATGLTDHGTTSEGHPAFRMPELDRSWDKTLDSLRPQRKRGEDFFEWRSTPPRPVTFTPVEHLSTDVEQLHLAHPVVRRVLDRFLAQGFSAHDLSRVSSVVAPKDSVIRVIAYARLSLFGPGAARLHDELVPIVAAWDGDPATAAKVEPYKDSATSAKAIESTESLLATGAAQPSTKVRANIQKSADALFTALWRRLEEEADARAVRARNGLAGRARKEADDLRVLLERQRKAIRTSLTCLRQIDLLRDPAESGTAAEQRRQLELDLQHMTKREQEMERDLELEPQAIAALYEVRMTRLTPVGLVVSWPKVLT